METTSKQNETITQFNQLATQTGTLIIDSFNKQIEISFEFYRNFLNSWQKENNPVSSITSFNDKVNEINKSLLSHFQKEIQLSQENWAALNEKVTKLMEESRRTNQALLGTATENFYRQLNYFTELNKKFLNEAGKQFSNFAQQNENHLSEILKGKENSNGSEKEAKADNKFIQVKKPALNS